MTHWSLLPGELFAFKDALRKLHLPAHVLAFSRSCDAVLDAVATYASNQQALSVSLIAPSGDRDNTLGVLRKTGSPIATVVDEHGSVLEVGRRRTRVPVALAEVEPVPLRTSVNSFSDRARILREHAIPLRIFASPQDAIVDFSLTKQLGEASGINVIEVQAPSGFSASAHDFDAVHMHNPVIDFIRSHVISQRRKFIPLLPLYWEKTAKTPR